MFINVLPMRLAVTEESDLLDWLRELQATMVELRRFEAIPVSKIQAWSDVPAGMPLFESILIVQNLPFLASLQERGNRLGIESARYLERTHYPLTITVVPGNELAIKISFDSRRFDAGRNRAGTRSSAYGPRGDGFKPRAATRRPALVDPRVSKSNCLASGSSLHERNQPR